MFTFKHFNPSNPELRDLLASKVFSVLYSSLLQILTDSSLSNISILPDLRDLFASEVFRVESSSSLYWSKDVPLSLYYRGRSDA